MSARGDQCDHCATILEPLELLQKKCKLCGDEPTRKQTEHFYFKLSAFQAELERYLEVARNEGRWRENAIHLTERYLQEGLLDRAVSRDLSIGVPVPKKGYEDKKIYVWIEAVSGYYSASKQWAEATGQMMPPSGLKKPFRITFTVKTTSRFIRSFGHRYYLDSNSLRYRHISFPMNT